MKCFMRPLLRGIPKGFSPPARGSSFLATLGFETEPRWGNYLLHRDVGVTTTILGQESKHPKKNPRLSPSPSCRTEVDERAEADKNVGAPFVQIAYIRKNLRCTRRGGLSCFAQELASRYRCVSWQSRR